MNYVITTVHGTFAPDAAWAQQDSAFCERLQRGLEGQSIVRRYQWSGRNSHDARSDAVGALCHYLEEGKRLYPTAEHIVVAHSHGGNVALWSARQSNAVDRIVCMATPFISATVRTYRDERQPLPKTWTLGLPIFIQRRLQLEVAA